jgi:hypothetical protein
MASVTALAPLAALATLALAVIFTAWAVDPDFGHDPR